MSKELTKISSEDSNQQSEDQFQFLIDKFHLFSQKEAAEIFFNRCKKKGYDFSKFLGAPLNKNAYYIQLRKGMNGNFLRQPKTIYSTFKTLVNLVAEKDKNFYTIDDLKSCIKDEIQLDVNIPVEISDTKKKDRKVVSIKKNDNNENIEIDENTDDFNVSLTYEELWHSLGDTSFFDGLLDVAKRDLENSIIKNSEETIKPFIKDKKGEPLLDFQTHHTRKLVNEFNVDEIKDEQSLKLISELASIFDKRAELTNRLDDGNTINLFFKSNSERIQSKIRGYEIFKTLRRKGIKISFHQYTSNHNFNSNLIESHNILMVSTNIVLNSEFTITYGDKAKISEFKRNHYRESIESHSNKILALIENKLLIGRHIKK